MNNKEVRLIVSDIQDMMETIADKLEHLYENHIDVEEFKKEKEKAEDKEYKKETLKKARTLDILETVHDLLGQSVNQAQGEKFASDRGCDGHSLVYNLLVKALGHVGFAKDKIETDKRLYWDK